MLPALRALVTALVAFLAVALGAVPAAADDDAPAASDLVLVGVGGLHWSDVDRTTTPTLWRMNTEGSVGSISVHTGSPVTCPVDAWLTISAGRRTIEMFRCQSFSPSTAGSLTLKYMNGVTLVLPRALLVDVLRDVSMYHVGMPNPAAAHSASLGTGSTGGVDVKPIEYALLPASVG